MGNRPATGTRPAAGARVAAGTRLVDTPDHLVFTPGLLQEAGPEFILESADGFILLEGS